MSERTASAAVDLASLGELLRARWSLQGELTDLGSLQDVNVLVDGGGGRHVLKLAGGGADRGSIALEHAALAHLGDGLDPIALPRPVPSVDGADVVEAGGRPARLMTWVPGAPLAALAHLDERMLAQLGALAARCGAALADFEDPGAGRESDWDPRRAPEVVARLRDRCPPPARAALAAAVAPLTARVAAGLSLPAQVVHGDVTDENVTGRLAADGTLTLVGLLDFGDLVGTWRIADAAATAVAAAARRTDDPLGAVLAVLDGYASTVTVSEPEADAVWDVTLARAAACVALMEHEARESPDNARAAQARDAHRGALRALLSVPAALATAACRVACGAPPLAAGTAPDRAPAPVAEILASATSPTALDLSVGSDLLHDGAWETPAGVAAAIAGASRAGPVAGRWGEARLVHAGAPGSAPPTTLHLGVDRFAPAGEPVHAPLPGRVHATGERGLELAVDWSGRVAYVRLAGVTSPLAPGTAVAAGDPVARVAEPGRSDPLPAHVHVQLSLAPGLPGLGRDRGHERAAWLAICPDPSPLAGLPADAGAAAEPTDDDALARRRRVLAGAQPLYYRSPGRTVRGWRAQLFDGHGRPYLDVVNNIAVVGHSHPRVTDAAVRQLRLLNTNSRFLYDAMTEYAERIVALLPAELSSVFLVNSGSEAMDLAIQLAQAATGRRDLAAIAGAYHGWTGAVYEACTSPQDNPGWRETIPEHVHVCAQPDPYRGPHGDDAEPYIASVAQACERASARGGLAAFMAEALLGNQGAVVPPAGYLAGAYAAVRAAGGLCIADEVQVGWARTGESFWAFEHERVVPDVVAAAKATGNGHPIGVVACRPEIADALGRRASFFSSTGGGPVSSRIGTAVLDVISDEGLQANAARVGARLAERLRGLAERRELIGAVQGRGLYLGVDLVSDRETRAPATEQAIAVCERLRELGVIAQPTGDAANVLKVKPPLCVTDEEAEMFVQTLDRALDELERGWAAR